MADEKATSPLRSAKKPSKFELETTRRFVEQEHRLFPAIANLLKYRAGPEEMRRSAMLSVGWCLTSRAMQAATTGGLGLVAIFSLYLAWRSNELVERQNETLNQQTILIDAQRRSSLNIELSSIWDAIKDEAPTRLPTHPFRTSNVLTARIIAISRALTPYQTLDLTTPTAPLSKPTFLNGSASQRLSVSLTKSALSPERGQLLQALARVGADLEFLSHSGATFAYADLRSQILSFVNGQWIDLRGADFTGSVLWRTDFTAANLDQSNMTCVYFEHVRFGFGGGGHIHGGILFQDTDLRDFRVTNDMRDQLGTNLIHPDVLETSNITGASLAGMTISKEVVLYDFKMPSSFDAKRYILITQNDGSLVVKARDPVQEEARNEERFSRCTPYIPAIDSRMARIMWGEVLSGEWEKAQTPRRNTFDGFQM